MKDFYSVACGIDNNYVQHACVMLESLSMTNKENFFDVYVLSLDVSTASKSKMSMLFKDTNLNLQYIDIDGSLLKKFPIRKTDYISLASYLRLFLPDILPSDIDKILYLDSDIVVTGNLKQLISTDVSGYFAAACLDADQTNCDRLHYDNSMGYYNAGVFLFNLSEIRKSQYMELVNDFLSNVGGQLKYHDQDILNYLFKGRILTIDHKWNLLDCYYYNNGLRNLYPDVTRALENPSIIHYTSGFKPWNYGCRHPLKSKYFYYLDMIPWGNKRLHRYVAFNRLHLWAKIIILFGGTPQTVGKVRDIAYRILR